MKSSRNDNANNLSITISNHEMEQKQTNVESKTSMDSEEYAIVYENATKVTKLKNIPTDSKNSISLEMKETVSDHKTAENEPDAKDNDFQDLDKVFLNPKKTAIVFIEYQNDFVKKGGKLYANIESELGRQHMLDNAEELLNYARDHNIYIIHAPITYCPDYEQNANRYGVLYNVACSSAFGENNEGAEFYTPMAPKKGEFIVKGKHGLDTFAGTDLDDILQSLNIENVALCGLLTNCCVESTMRTGYEYGYSMITIHDCCTATSKEGHENSVNNTFGMFSIPVTSKQFRNASSIEAMEQYPELPPSSVMHSRQKKEYGKLTQNIAGLMISRCVSLIVIIQLLITVTDNDENAVDNNIILEIYILFVIAICDIISTFLLFVMWCYCSDRSKFENSDSWLPAKWRRKRAAKITFLVDKSEQIISIMDIVKVILCVSVVIKSFSSTSSSKSMISSLIFTLITGMLELINIVYIIITKMSSSFCV